MKFLPWVVAGVLAAVLGLGSARGGDAAPAELRYNTKVAYRERAALTFPHFTILYKGPVKVTPPKGLHGWDRHEFVVTSEGKEQVVNWSSGTGDIGPTHFEVRGRKFLLELSVSDTLGRLKPGELVIREAK